MDKILSIDTLEDPNFIKPILINYIQQGKKKKWEAVLSHNSVAILLYHKEKQSFVIVKQLRPPVFNIDNNDGYMHELCAGIIDKKLSDKEIAREEVLEECGYDIPLEKLEKITTFYTSVGISGASQTLYYAQIDEKMQCNEGGGLAEEEIEVIYLPLADAKKFMFDQSYKKTPGMLMAFYWFFENKLSK